MDSILFVRTYSNKRPAYSERLSGAMSVAHEYDWRIQTVDKPNHGKISALIDLWHPHGAIVESAADAQRFPSSLFGGIPVVYLDAHHSDIARMDGRIGCVEHDPNATARIAAKELLSGDCASYAFIPNFFAVPWSRAREAAFRETLALNGKEPVSFQFKRKTEDMTRWHIDLCDFLKRLPKPCGVFAANDYVGESVLVACADIGLSVPGDVAVVGVDNYDIVCENTTPTLSSVALDFVDAGRISVRLLEKLVHSRRNAFEIRTFGVLGLVRRASSLRLKRNFPGVAQAIEAIRTKACEKINVETALSGMNCSRRLAEMRFRLATGKSPLEAIHDRRLEHACELLSATDSSVEAIANMCGYGSAVFLQKLFRRRTGLTPSEWRARNRAAAATAL